MKFKILLFVAIIFIPFSAVFTAEEPTPTKQEVIGNPAVLEPLEQEILKIEREAPSYSALFMKTMLLVILLLIVTTAGLYLLKRTQARLLRPRERGAIIVIEKQALSQKTQAILLQVKDKEVLIIESAHQISMCSLDSSEKKEII